MKTPLKAAIAAIAMAWAIPTLVSAQAHSPDSVLRLEDVLALARSRNPRLQALQAAAKAAAYREPEASTLPDPMLQLGVMNFGLPNFNADMPTSMAPSVQLMQMVPFPGKLSLKGDIASYAREMADASADEAWWNVRERASSMFYDLYTLDRRLEVMGETLSLLKDFQQVAKAMYVAGTGHQADVLRADVEVARMDGDIRQMKAMREGTAARLNALVDRPAETPLPSPVLGNLPDAVPGRDTLLAWAEESRPALARSRDGVAQARKRSELAGKQIWPDLTFGVTYAQRNRGAGPERMGSAMVGFSLPIHAGSRQYAARDEAMAMERLAEAELGGVRADVDARVGELLAELDRARTLADLYKDEVIPEARSTVESAFSSYRVGKVDFMTLVDAQMTVNRYQGELYELLGDYGKAMASLESAVGRPMPHTDKTVVEER
ncbi:MAG: TolC family protein [Gemmatimonadetes bacterium]|nr:TolC family protein [Gemmatimonadota bacterium]